MTKKALEANVLLCDNNTVKIHYVNQSDFLKINLAFLTRSLVETIIFISNKVFRISRRIKQGGNR